MRIKHKTVCIKGEVYVFGGYEERNENEKFSVEKYSPATNTWNVIAKLHDDRKEFCACAFMDKIFVLGGRYGSCYEDNADTASCLQFDTKANSWKEVAAMQQARYSAACTVFNGDIVISGGEHLIVHNNYNRTERLNTVESYDVFSDSWTSMPNTNRSYDKHNLVVVRSKLFVFECRCLFETFDNVSKTFVAVKSPFNWNPYCKNVISIESQLVTFDERRSRIYSYDLDKEERSVDLCENLDNMREFSCVKVPMY